MVILQRDRFRCTQPHEAMALIQRLGSNQRRSTRIEARPLLAWGQRGRGMNRKGFSRFKLRGIPRGKAGRDCHQRCGPTAAPAMRHGRVIIVVRRTVIGLAQRNRHQLSAAGRTETAPQHLLAGRLWRRPGKRHGKHVEQHCKAGNPGKCHPTLGHGRCFPCQ